jgi:sirohydrochlorin cobaltochelatase
MAKVKEGNYKKVVLRPMMVVAGDHANNDMAGPDEDSWKSQFEAEGFDVTVVLEGLGQVPAIQELYAEHAKAAIAKLN